jgi:hypothetical protein
VLAIKDNANSIAAAARSVRSRRTSRTRCSRPRFPKDVAQRR